MAAEIFQSNLSVQSVALKSQLSALAAAATKAIAPPSSPTPKPTPTPQPTPTPTPQPSPTPTPKSAKGSKSPSRGSTTASTIPSSSASPNAGSSSGGTSGGVIATVVVLLLAALLAVGFFVWRWHKKRRNGAMKSNLWTSSPSYSGAGKAESGLMNATTPTPYVFGDAAISSASAWNRPVSEAPPALPSKEQGRSSMSQYLPVSGQYKDTSLEPPSPAHSPRPRSSEVEGVYDPYLDVQRINSQHQRNDSGPALLYSTPPTDRDYGFGYNDRRRSVDSRASKAISTLPNPHVPSYDDVPPVPMRVPIPEPIPATPSSTSPSPHASLASGASAPRLTLSPSKAQEAAQMRASDGTRSPQLPPYSSPLIAPSSAEQIPASSNDRICRVIRTYLPSMMDELKVSVGERVRLVNEYDDGWGYCEKVGDPDGAAGVVPLECLDKNNTGRISNISSSNTDTSSHRISARFSSFNVDFDSIRASRQ